MSTRCNIHFTYGDNVAANIYRHCEGYPESLLPDLEEFFKAVESQTNDTRFNDPSYLAAKFIVWQAAQNAWDTTKPLAFLSVGVMTQNAGDGEYVYRVDCNQLRPDGRPTVTWQATR